MGGGEGRFISALCCPLTLFSICKYLQTAMSGIYVKVTMPELAVQLFQSAPYQSRVEINEMDNKQNVKSVCTFTIAKRIV